MKRNILTVLLLVIGCILGSGVAHAQVDRTQPPAPGPIPKAVFPPFTEGKLNNGIRVVVVEDHRQPIVYFRTLVLSGGAVDNGHVGTAGAVAALLEKGTTTRSADDIARTIDFYGSEFTAGASADDINIFTAILTKDLDQVLPVYADAIEHPIFPKDELTKFISNKLAELKQSRQDPSYPGRMMGRKLVFGDHPYNSVETEETVNALTQEILRAWHAKNFCANNMIIAVNGDVSMKTVLPMLEKYFGSLGRGIPDKPKFTPLHDIVGTPVILIDRPGSVQSSIRIQRLGLRRGDPDFYKASFLASIFCGNGDISFGHRLFQNIREKHGYTYTPGGGFTASVDRGILVAVAEVRNAVTDSALDQMLIEYRRLATEEVPADELAHDKKIVTGGYLMSLADPGTTSNHLLEIMEYGLPNDYFQTYANRINALTASELKAVGEKVFSPNDIAIIVTGDAKEIKSKLERFGKVQVYDLDLKPEGMSQYQSADITLNQLLDKFYTALGKSALEKISDRTIDASITLSYGGQELPGKLMTVEAAPNKKYEKLTLSLGTMENWVDGEHVWQQQGPQSAELKGEDLKHELMDAEFNPELHLQDKDRKVSLLGMTTLKGGDDAYVLQIDREGANPEKWYIGKKSGLLEQRDVIQQGAVTSMHFSDYRPVDGVMSPYTVSMTGGQELTIKVESIKMNTHPDAAIFVKK